MRPWRPPFESIVLAALAALAMARPASAEPPAPRPPTLVLAAECDAVITACPCERVEAKEPRAARRWPARPVVQRFAVLEVLRGAPAIVTDTVIEVAGMSRFRRDATRNVSEVLLFLARPTKRGGRWTLLRSSMQGNQGGRVAWPTQFSIPGSLDLVAPKEGEPAGWKPGPPLSWKDYVARVRARLASLRPLHAARALPEARARAAGVLAWLEARGDALRSDAPEEAGGWSAVRGLVFGWLFEDADDGQAFEGLRLWWRVAQPPEDEPIHRAASLALCTQAGRSALTRLLGSRDTTPRERLAVLDLLRRRGTLQAPQESARGLRTLTPDGKARLLPLLADLLGGDAACRLPAARAIAAVHGVLPGATILRRYDVARRLARAVRDAEDPREAQTLRALLGRIDGTWALTVVEAETEK